MTDDPKKWKALQYNYDDILAASDEPACYQLSPRDIALILPGLEYAKWKTRYYSPAGIPILADSIEQWVAVLYDRLWRTGDCGDEPGQCNDYKPDAALITYAPNDPFTNPDYIAPGFLLPAWYKVTTVPPLIGLQPGDVLTDLSRMLENPFEWILPPPFSSLPALINSGFPRFRIHWYAAAESNVEIHLLRAPFFGLALISLDDNPLDVDWLNLTEDITDISTLLDFFDARLFVEHIYEKQVSAPGEHHIDVTMLPYPGETFPYAHFGGGFRKLVICGESVAPVMPQPKFRFTAECGLEVSVNEGASWQAVEGWSTYAPGCFTGPVGPAGPSGPDGSPGPVGPAGPAGQDGASPEMRMLGSYVQWRQDDNTPTWTNLFDTSTLGGSGNALAELKKEKCRLIASGLFRRFNAAFDRFCNTPTTSGIAVYRENFERSWLAGRNNPWPVNPLTYELNDFYRFQDDWVYGTRYQDFTTGLYNQRAGLADMYRTTFTASAKIQIIAGVANELYCLMNDELVLSSDPNDFVVVRGAISNAGGIGPYLAEMINTFPPDLRYLHRFEEYHDQVTDLVWGDCNPAPVEDTCADLHGFDWCKAYDFIESPQGWYARVADNSVHVSGWGWVDTESLPAYPRLDLERAEIGNIGRVEVWQWRDTATTPAGKEDSCASLSVRQIYLQLSGGAYENLTLANDLVQQVWNRYPGVQFYVTYWDHHTSANDPSPLTCSHINFRLQCSSGVEPMRVSVQRVVIYGYGAQG